MRHWLKWNLQESGVGSWSTSQGLEPCGRLWPNGELSLGFARKKRDDTPPVPARSPDCKWTAEDVRHGAWVIEVRLMARAVALAAILGSASFRIGLSMVRNPHKRRGKYGLKGITGYGKKMVRSGAVLLQRRYGRGNLSFLTLTVPELSVNELGLIARSWGSLINRLMQFLQRLLESQGLPGRIVSVTELQPKRLLSGSLGCLHVHAVFQGRHGKRSAWILKPQEVRAWWLSALGRVIGRTVSSDSVENLQRVRKNADGYLGKYMSKGSEGAKKLSEMFGPEVVPGQWWNMDKGTRSWVKTETLSGSVASSYIESLIESHFDGDWLRPDVWIQAHYREYDGRLVLSGYSGRLSREQYIDLRAVIIEHLTALDPGGRMLPRQH